MGPLLFTILAHHMPEYAAATVVGYNYNSTIYVIHLHYAQLFAIFILISMKATLSLISEVVDQYRQFDI